MTSRSIYKDKLDPEMGLYDTELKINVKVPISKGKANA